MVPFSVATKMVPFNGTIKNSFILWYVKVNNITTSHHSKFRIVILDA